MSGRAEGEEIAKRERAKNKADTLTATPATTVLRSKQVVRAVL